MKCLLCLNPHSAPFKVLKKPERNYYYCAECDLIFMHPEERLSIQEEKSRYDHHENQGSAGHLAFLEPLIKDLHSQFVAAGLSPAQLTTLDFGCGPTPALSAVLAAKGYKTFHYDLYYHPDQDLLRRNYHMITSTEVWEHLQNPRLEIERMLRLLKPGGLLGVMTSAHRGEAHFHDWHYRRDLTHIVFYSAKTMEWIARTWNLHVLKAQSPYWIFQKLS